MDDQTNGLESRRSVIRKLGAGAGAATLGLGATGSATANESNPVFPDTNFVEETGPAKDRAIQAAVESDDYTTISNELFNMGWEIGDHSDAKVVRVETPENDIRQVVAFELNKTSSPRRRVRRTRQSSPDYSSGSVSFSLIDYQVDSTRAMLDKKEWSGGKTVSSQMNTEFPGRKISTTTKTISVDGGATTERRESEEIDVNKLDAAVSSQASATCRICTGIGDIVCGTGCSVAANTIICGSSAVASVGTAAAVCGPLVSTICGLIMLVSDVGVGSACEEDYFLEAICARANICESKPYYPPWVQE